MSCGEYKWVMKKKKFSKKYLFIKKIAFTKNTKKIIIIITQTYFRQTQRNNISHERQINQRQHKN